jgi:hypothetical protein
MITGRLAELFVDITLRGADTVVAQRNRINELDAVMQTSGRLYSRVAADRLDVMRRLADAESNVLAIDKKIYESKPYANAADARARRGLAGDAAAMARERADLLAQQRVLQSPLAIDNARAQLQNDRVRKQNTELQQWNQLVAEKGKALAVVAKLADTMRQVQDAARTTSIYAGALTAAGTAAVAAASPDIFGTFTGSLKLLSAEIGTIVAPMLIDFAAILQRVANWVRSLDDETKESILTGAKWVAIIGFGSMALDKLVSVGGGAIRVLMAISSAAVSAGRAITAAFVANPIIAAIAAITVVVAGLLALLDHLATRTERMTAASRQTTAYLQGGGRLTQQQYDRLPQETRDQIALARKQGKDQQVLDRLIDQAEQRANTDSGEASNRDEDAQRALAPSTIAARAAQSSMRTLPTGILTATFLSPLIKQNEQLGRSGTATAAQSAEQLAILRARKEQGDPASGKGGDDLLRSSTFQSQFTSFDEGWRRVQLAATSGGTMEQRMLEIQERNRDYLRQIAANTGGEGGAGVLDQITQAFGTAP